MQAMISKNKNAVKKKNRKERGDLRESGWVNNNSYHLYLLKMSGEAWYSVLSTLWAHLSYEVATITNRATEEVKSWHRDWNSDGSDIRAHAIF